MPEEIPSLRWQTRQTTAAGVLVAASYAFRLPALLNARSTNSDAAVVGLQAMHILRGEHSPFLWGSGYQTSADSYVAAGFFAIFGATPLVLMLSALTLHVAATLCVFATMTRRFTPWQAFVLVLPLVLTPSSVHSYALYPPRQVSLTLALVALSALDNASWGRQRWLFVGGLAYGLAVSADPYPLVLAPVVMLLGMLVAADARKHLARGTFAFATGGALGLVPFVLLHSAARAKSGPMGLTLDAVGHHFDLLLRECLPWALSYKVYYAYNVMDYRPWQAPVGVYIVQIAGALAVLVLVAIAFLLVRRRTIPWSIRRLGLVGALTYPIAIGGFLSSVMVMDHFSMRYLAVLTLMLPFASVTAAHLLGMRRFATILLPHLVAAAIGGWVGFGPFVRGPLPVRETPSLRDDYALFALLRTKGVTYAEADYWASYRLTLLSGETIIVVPTNASEDRYAPHRRAFTDALKFAYVFDPGRSREDLAAAEQTLRTTYTNVEKTYAGGHTVFVVVR